MPLSYLGLRKLEFSRDPLSDTTPTWVDISAYFLGGDWADGKSDDLSEGQAGTATFRLWNQARRFEPDFAAGAYYPDIKPMRRFRLTVSDATTNLVTNPGFDTDLTGWTVHNDPGGDPAPTNTRDTSVFRTGPASLKSVCTTNTGFKGASVTVSGLTVGSRYTASVWVSGGTVGSGIQVILTAAGFPNFFGNLTAAWQRIDVPFLASATTTTMLVRTNAASTTFYLDDVSVTAGGQQGLWYATSWDVTNPHGTNYSEVVVSCVDGHGLLSLDALDLLEPATAATYEEVVMQDQPWGYWRLGDAAGAKMAAASGPDGSYHGGPALGQEGLLLGDSDTAATFVLSKAQYGKATVAEANQFSEPDTVTCEAWVTLNDDSVDTAFVTGPENAVNGPIFALYYSQTIGRAVFEVIQTSGTTTSTDTPITEGVTYHLVGVWDGRNRSLKLYKDGVLMHTEGTATLSLISAPASEAVRVGRWGTTGLYANATIDEAAVYEHALTAERVLAHYQAGAERGFPEQTAGERIADVVDSPLWLETGIQTGEHMVHPVMEHGQSKLAEILAAVKAEMPDSQFFYDPDGNPTYLAWNYKDGLGPLATFGNASGEVPFEAVSLVYDDAIFNEVTVSHQSGPGEETQHTETDTDSVDEFYRRAHSETGLILQHHDDAVAVAAAILEHHSQPRYRATSLTLSGSDSTARAQILTRQIGDMIRVKHRGEGGGLPVDLVTTILGTHKSLDPETGHLSCTWTLARGFDADAGLWQLGISGWSELQTTTVLG